MAQIFAEADVPMLEYGTTEGAWMTTGQVNAMLVELQEPEVGRIAQMGVPVQLR